jgi:hypothetical protein
MAYILNTNPGFQSLINAKTNVLIKKISANAQFSRQTQSEMQCGSMSTNSIMQFINKTEIKVCLLKTVTDA